MREGSVVFICAYPLFNLHIPKWYTPMQNAQEVLRAILKMEDTRIEGMEKLERQLQSKVISAAVKSTVGDLAAFAASADYVKGSVDPTVKSFFYFLNYKEHPAALAVDEQPGAESADSRQAWLFEVSATGCTRALLYPRLRQTLTRRCTRS